MPSPFVQPQQQYHHRAHTRERQDQEREQEECELLLFFRLGLRDAGGAGKELIEMDQEFQPGLRWGDSTVLPMI
jgi:hypothetical protein